ncbi:MAG: Fic family protein [Candidatus Margulisbacteria bacterium]|nr:Fic family protein [Candidatus Margulisiibacteriota bacterium]
MQYNKENPYILGKLPPNIDFESSKLKDALLRARVALAELKGYSFSMPNPFLLLSPAVLRESLASSEIENIHTTIVEVLQNQLFPEKEQRKPDKEVLRYKDAVVWGYENLDKYSISTRLILGIQKKLVHASHGEYRKQQNAIVNHLTKERIYTPPVARDVPELMGNLENFINNPDDGIDPLIKAAIAHYQFEAIHPFGDGNGRTGRILMVLFLIMTEVLKWPILYISGYINKNRTEYYRLLNDISANGSWEEFILFMLDGFYFQAKETNKVLFEIMSLFDNYKTSIKQDLKSIYSADLVEQIFSFPIITPAKLGKALDIHYVTAGKYLTKLSQAGFVKEQKYGKYRLFINQKLISIIEGE